jgi:hypothetical protein
MILLSILAHHSEPGDPVLLDWIMHRIDAFVGLGPGAIVILLSLLVVAIPLGIVAVYFIDRARHSRSEL